MWVLWNLRFTTYYLNRCRTLVVENFGYLITCLAREESWIFWFIHDNSEELVQTRFLVLNGFSLVLFLWAVLYVLKRHFDMNRCYLYLDNACDHCQAYIDTSYRCAKPSWKRPSPYDGHWAIQLRSEFIAIWNVCLYYLWEQPSHQCFSSGENECHGYHPCMQCATFTNEALKVTLHKVSLSWCLCSWPLKCHLGMVQFNVYLLEWWLQYNSQAMHVRYHLKLSE